MSKVVIDSIKAYEILDSRSNPTLSVEVLLSDGSSNTSFVPSGASTGTFEAKERRDFDNKRYHGKGVLEAVETVNRDLNKLLKNQEALDQQKIDYLMCKEDGTEDKSNFGANSILGVSIACAKSVANSLDLPLHEYLSKNAREVLGSGVHQKMPIPMMNILNGGVHADNSLDFQEFMIMPVGFDSYRRSIQCGVEIYNCLKEILKKENLSSSVGDEGGFAPDISSPEEALDLISRAIEVANYEMGREVILSLDVAASEFYSDEKYLLGGIGKDFSSSELVSYFSQLITKYPISSIEDGLSEDDWQGWTHLTKDLGTRSQLVGDDLFVTNHRRLERGIKNNAANAILIKLNQIGTITETLETIKLANSNSYKTIISHRSGETEDTFIADFVVAVGSGQIKTGAPSRSERTSKYNRLLMIEDKTAMEYLGINEFK